MTSINDLVHAYAAGIDDGRARADKRSDVQNPRGADVADLLPEAESLSLRDEIKMRYSELSLDALQAGIVDLHGSDQVNKHCLVDLDDVAGRTVCVMPCGTDVDLAVKPLAELHVASPSAEPLTVEEPRS